jgi:hypothetical protein
MHTVIVREPRIEPFAILDLRPTQMTIGMHEVEAKRKRWRAEKHTEEFLGKHLIPVIHGPKDRYYIIDHHHLARALYEEGIKNIGVAVIANLSTLHRNDFWYVMDHKAWVHPFAYGKRYPYSDLPKSIDQLTDDPFRSLAGELRRAGGFSKETVPFSEFLWANFLRRHLNLKDKDLGRDFDWAIKKALELAKSAKGDYLPGWCGPIPEE